MEREVFYNYMACRRKAIERSWRVSPGETHCGLCILVCPRTKKYISAAGSRYSFPAVDIASKGELKEILQLQKLAYQSEAGIYNDFSIPPLVQTLEELEEEARNSIVLKVVEDRKIVGSVRAYEKAGSCYISKLIVHPDYQNRGIGKKLIAAAEKCFEHVRYELFTGHLSRKNLSLYEKLGYKAYKTCKVNENMELIHLEK
jgi:GNAT superfamily N-acetyltransferase